MPNTKLDFLPNNAGETEGLGDAGIETYKDAPFASCAREAGQNAKDAESIKPVKMAFDLIEIDVEQLPEFEKLRATIKSCLDTATQEKDIDFFNEANSTINAKKIKILRISDFNTKGLVGPADKKESPFYSLLKASGISNKDKHTSGGSFGIGKNASFAVSKLRTVYYSTVYFDSELNKNNFLAQGKVKLVSHRDENDQDKRATGYWGYENYSAVNLMNDVPEWMRRNEIGTSIFCVGFDESPDWKYRMAYSLLVNFFCGIDRNEMIFEIDDGSIKLNTNTISDYFNDAKIQAAATVTGHKDDLSFSHNLFKCLRSSNSSDHILNMDDIGDIQVKVLLEENLPKRIGFIRNGMYITKALKNFNQSLERFPGAMDFIALVEPVNDTANKFLKVLENPAHNDFSAERISDPKKRDDAKRAMENLGKRIREVVKSVATPEIKPKMTLDELANIFASKGNISEKQNGNLEKDPENYIYDLRDQVTKNLQPKSFEPKGTAAGGATRRGNGNWGRHISNLGSPGAKASGLASNFRNFIDGNNSEERKVFITFNDCGKVRLKFSASGIVSPEDVSVLATSKGIIDKGNIILDVDKNERVELNLIFEDEYSGPIEISTILEK